MERLKKSTIFFFFFMLFLFFYHISMLIIDYLFLFDCCWDDKCLIFQHPCFFTRWSTSAPVASPTFGGCAVRRHRHREVRPIFQEKNRAWAKFSNVCPFKKKKKNIQKQQKPQKKHFFGSKKQPVQKKGATGFCELSRSCAFKTKKLKCTSSSWSLSPTSVRTKTQLSFTPQDAL